MVAILLLLRKRFSIGAAMLAGSVCVWITAGAQLPLAWQSAVKVISMQRTYDLIFALYFVMCLELQLRLSGTLDGLLTALHRWFKSERVTLALMPAFLGLLPSLGGARFSAPMVDQVGDKVQIDAESKSVINFWFRHVVEYINPINPGMILASSISMIPLSELIGNMFWVSLAAIAIGWFYCIPREVTATAKVANTQVEEEHNVKEVTLALAPIIFNFILIVFADINPAISMGIITFAMFFVLYFSNRVVNIKKVLTDAWDKKLIMNVMSILFFIQILTYTKTLQGVVDVLTQSSLPLAVIIGIISLIIGILTGISQGHVAMVMPLVAAVAPNDVNMACVAMVLGVAGQMITPTHLCLIVTLDYFKADFFKSLKPILVMQGLVVAVFVAVKLLF